MTATWLELKITLAEAEDQAPFLFDYGVQGVEILDDNKLRCFIEEDQEKILQLKAFLADNSGELTGSEVVKIDGWIESCQELQTAVQIGQLTFAPEHINQAQDSQAIRIRYGCGFGTGHHAATQMVIELLQSEQCRSELYRSELCRPNQNCKALDLGTGSGILAIAITKLYGLDVLATDNDQMALDNANDNINLNSLGASITLSNLDIKHISSNFGLVVANIYAEVLCDLADLILARLEPNALLIMSGIKEELAKDVVASFSSLELIEKRTRDGWCALLMRKS